MRYQFACGYCGVREVDAGGELLVDHFHPVSAGGTDAEDNFVYACLRSNLYKAAFSPSKEDWTTGRRLLHPLQDDMAAHVRNNRRTGELEPVSSTGQFHIDLLQLNRPALVASCLKHTTHEATLARIQGLEAENERLRKLLDAFADISTSEE